MHFPIPFCRPECLTVFILEVDILAFEEVILSLVILRQYIIEGMLFAVVEEVW